MFKVKKKLFVILMINFLSISEILSESTEIDVIKNEERAIGLHIANDILGIVASGISILGHHKKPGGKFYKKSQLAKHS
jgi:uncharacterized membrane protein YjfL (UPF0719 family)